MIKFKGINKNTKKHFIGFGLSEENIKRLKENLPIVINGEDINSIYDYVIFYGKTEGDMYQELSNYINIAATMSDINKGDKNG